MFLLLAFIGSAYSGVPSEDVILQEVVSDNLPVITSLTSYNYSSDNDARTVNIGGVTVPYDVPLYTPFDTDLPAWWDNLVAELLQARLPVVMHATRGVRTTNPNDLNGGLNPRQLTRMVAALDRANAANLIRIACFVDTPALRDVYQDFHSAPSGSLMDLSVESDWNDIFWIRGVKPWFDTVPRQYWYRINGRPVIQWWSLSSTWFFNHKGNASRMLQFLADAFYAAYGERPGFILDGSWPDPSSLDQPDVIGMNNWFGPPSTAYTFYKQRAFTFGTAVPGFINPQYFNPTSSNYQSPSLVVPHNGVSGAGQLGDTLIEGLEGAVASNSKLTVLEGWNDVREWAGFYRSEAAPYAFPSQRINIVRQYTDLRTVTLRLEAEGADAFMDTTSGNSGGRFRRAGDLDIRLLSSNVGWAVTNTAAGEWIQFNKVFFSAGNYRFPIKYSSTSQRSVRLWIDGVALPDVTLPATGGANTFDTAYLGSTPLSHGPHTLKLEFVDGGIDVDWIFVKKTDKLATFRSASSQFLTARSGGNSSIASFRNTSGAWEMFTIDDLNGGQLSSGDEVNIQTWNGLYLSAANGGGAALAANKRTPDAPEKFTLELVGGSGSIAAGAQVAIRSSNGNYVTVKGDGSVDVSATTVGAAQTFSIAFSESGDLPSPAVPATPGGFNAAAGDARATLAWTAVQDATSYFIKRATEADGIYAIVAEATGTNYVDTTAINGTTYFYAVCASNGSGESPDSSPLSVTPQPPAPTAPTQLAATSGNSYVSLTWGVRAGATGYNVKRSATSSGTFGTIAQTSTASFVDTSVTNGSTYFYRVSAFNGGGESANSSSVTGSPTARAPAAPTGVVATGRNGQVLLQWNASLGLATSYNIRRATSSSGQYATIGSSTSTAFIDRQATNGTTFFYTIVAVNANGSSSASSSTKATPMAGVPAPWMNADVGNTGVAGSASLSGSTFTLSGSGSDIWGAADATHFMSRSVDGNCVITARITSQQNTDAWAKAGVMIRESLAAGSRYAAMLRSPGNGAAYFWREGTSGETARTGTATANTPFWLRVVRTGNAFTGYRSSDGSNWTNMGSATLEMGSKVYIGLAATSHNNTVLCTVTFDNVTITALPARPDGLTAAILSESQVRLNWTDLSESATGFRVQRSLSGANTWTTIADSLAAADQAHTDGGLLASTGYGYRVMSKNADGVSAPAEISVVTPAGVGDGIPGWWRLQHFGNGLSVTSESGRDADPDGDGMSNVREFAAGTDPKNAASVFLVTQAISEGANFRITFPSVSGKRYTVEKKENLGDGTWAPVRQIDGTGFEISILDPIGSRAFYRVKVE